jgi:diphthamide biosynthesis protein 2
MRITHFFPIRFYTFVVGKLNPAKLANFPEIDCYVIIACPENSLQIDVKEFYRPVITPFELEVALNIARTWTGNYITDFRQLLPGMTVLNVSLIYTMLNGKNILVLFLSGSSGYVEFSSAGNDQQTDVSLVSGRMRTLGFENDLGEFQNETLPNKNTSELVRQSNSHVSVLPSGSEFLKLNRGWSGLEPRIGETPVPCMATEGRRGIASGYVNETSEGNFDGDD